MNKAILIGNLTRDPESRTTSSGVAVCTFTIAVNRRFVNQQTGQREADFLSIVTWRQTAENCAKYLAKGRKVGVVGTIQTRSYDAQDGTKRYVTEIVADEVEFLSPAQQGTQQDAAQQNSIYPSAQSTAAPPPRQMQERMQVYGFPEEDSDELPF